MSPAAEVWGSFQPQSETEEYARGGNLFEFRKDRS